MSDTAHDRALHVIVAAHGQLATFARDSYELEGRGVIRVEAPDLQPGTTALVMSNMVFHTLEQMRDLTADLHGDSRDDADVLLRMIETYEPAQQAVVMVGFATGNPISVKMKLERLLVVDEPAGLH